MHVQDDQHRRQVGQMLFTLSPMVIDGRFSMAYEYYNLRGGKDLMPNMEEVFSTLRDIPYLFAKQWKKQIGGTVILAFQKNPDVRLRLLVNDVIGNTVYATDTQTRQAYTFTIHDLIPEDQQQSLQGINPVALSIWIGCEYAACGRKENAKRVFRSLDLLGEFLIQEMDRKKSNMLH